MIRVLVLACALLWTPTAAAIDAGGQLADPRLETRARAMFRELRCVVCQNQSIDDSDAGIAKDLRQLVRQRLNAGEDEAAIRTMLVDRYGEFVLFRPAWNVGTIALWLTPLLLLGAGVAYVTTRTPKRPREAALDPNEEARLRRLIDCS